MPTNLPPEYYEVQKRLKAADSPEEKLECLEELLTTVPKHKGTDKLRASLRQKISKLKTTSEAKSKTGKHDSVYRVEKEGPARVLVLGAPNVGKSALLNAILGQERVLVSAEPGTTRDAVDTPFEYQGKPLMLIDTAGIRRRGRGAGLARGLRATLSGDAARRVNLGRTP